MIRMAMRDVFHYRRESVGVTSQIAIGIALFIVALSFVGSIQQSAERLLFGTIGSTWVVEPATKGDVLTLDASSQERFLSTSGAQSVRPRLEITANVSNPSGGTERPASASLSFVGVDLGSEADLADNFGLPPERIAPGEIELHEKAARQLGVRVGDKVVATIGTTETAYRVGNIFVPRYPSFLLDSWAVVDRTTLAKSVYSDPTRINRLLVSAPENAEARAAIETSLQEVPANAVVSRWSDTSWSTLMLGPRIWGILLTTVFTFTFAVICVGLTSLVYSAMLARVRDFAVLKTAGASSGSLTRMYIGEVAMQYLVGYLIGALLAGIIILSANAVSFSSSNSAFTFAVGSTTLQFMPTWWAVLAPFVIGATLTISVLWHPIRSICSQPVLDLLEVR